MAFAPFGGECYLLLTLAKPTAVFFGIFGRAMVAGHALFIVWAGLVGIGDRATAGVTRRIWTGNKPMTNRDAAIKNVAFTVPKALGLRDVFEVFQDTAFEVIDFWNPLPQQVIC